MFSAEYAENLKMWGYFTRFLTMNMPQNAENLKMLPEIPPWEAATARLWFVQEPCRHRLCEVTKFRTSMNQYKVPGDCAATSFALIASLT